jgi:hypothetical protein
MTTNWEACCRFLQLKKNNQGQQRARISTRHDLGSSSSSILEEKTVRNDDEPRGSLSSFAIEEKQPRTTRSWDLGLSLFFVIEEKKLRDGNELLGLSSFFATQEKPTSRFFFFGL